MEDQIKQECITKVDVQNLLEHSPSEVLLIDVRGEEEYNERHIPASTNIPLGELEIYPKGFNKHWLGKWINTSVSHNLHHQYFKGNYGLYFTFWDRLMGTLRSDYDHSFEALKKREQPVSVP